MIVASFNSSGPPPAASVLCAAAFAATMVPVYRLGWLWRGGLIGAIAGGVLAAFATSFGEGDLQGLAVIFYGAIGAIDGGIVGLGVALTGRTMRRAKSGSGSGGEVTSVTKSD